MNLKWNNDGLIPAIVQQTGTGRVLMMAWMNRAALDQTLATGEMHYWSRSRQKIWRKGETSGHTQRLVRWFADCDGDTLLFEVDQRGGACHTGYQSCFFQPLNRDGTPAAVSEHKVFDPERVY
jgi:phosphoribosyl-AMP cyclohydrolase